MKLSMSSSALLKLLVIIAIAINCGDGCIQKLKRSSEINNFVKGCLVKAGFNKDSLPTIDDMMKSDFDDKCAAKCIYGSLELVDDSGRLDRDGYMDFLEENSPPALLLKLTELATICADSSGTDKIVGGSKQGATPAECTPFGTFHKCFVTAANKLC